MKRTTIVADEELLERLRVIARKEGTSLAQVIREGLELRAAQRRTLGFIGAVSSGEGPHDTAERAEEIIERLARDGGL